MQHMAKVRLAKMSVEDLEKEIRRRQRKLATLIAARVHSTARLPRWKVWAV
jgi:hypothetical protein